ncbi:helix-turn-helix transcriptional regulator [Acinetobacter sp. WU_MDCI_Axc73]|nr:helix-turn-helix transcriptional regulator [Acinetobacter sp. WU_MDCI_Axc73]
MPSDPNYFECFEVAQSSLYCLSALYPQHHYFNWHQHARAQLLYAVQGSMLVETHKGKWIVPAQHGVWLSPQMPHAISMLNDVHMRSIFIAPELNIQFEQAICVIKISALLRELIFASSEIHEPYTANTREDRINLLLLDELQQMPKLPFFLPWPTQSHLQHLCQKVLDEPYHLLRIEDISQQLNMSKITFQRHFQKQTGLSFGRWRQQARLLLALERLTQGEKILSIALDLGFSSQSAFSASFKQYFGISPSACFATDTRI